MTKPISAAFPFQSHTCEVLDSTIHYIDEGSGDPILFLHGNPTSSYLWRNIIPYVTSLGRAIAPDLIGMGRSDKPDIDYRFEDHYRYLSAFIAALGLDNITLVIHDWGSGLGFHYASQHPERIKGIAFMEAILRPLQWDDFPPDFRLGFQMMRAPGIGWLAVSVANIFVKQVLPNAVVRDLGDEEMAAYSAPFPTVASRKPVRQWPLEIPINGYPSRMVNIVGDYSAWLQQSPLPKLLFHANPGGLVPAEVVDWCRENLPNLTTVDIGPGIHFVQEDNPHLIGEELATWYQTL